MSGWTDVITSVAPAIATALGGPLAGMAVGFIAKEFGIDPDKVEQVVAQMGPADLVKMKELDTQFQVEMAKLGISLNLAQLDVDKAEASSTNWFVAGWRPFVGWICGFGLGYVAIAEPIGRFLAQVCFKYTGAFPVIDTTLTMQVLMGMLGMAAARTYEKVKDAEGNR